MDDVVVVILAGGQSSRMGGGDKFMRPLGEKRIIDHVINRARGMGKQIVLNANGDAARFADLNIPVIADLREKGEGPLAGVHAGLNWAKQRNLAGIVTVAADTPFFPTDLAVSLLHQSLNKTHIVIAKSPGEDGRYYPQPTFGFWPVFVCDALGKSLDDEVYKIMRFVRSQPHNFCTFKSGQAFFNINTPDDIDIAAEIVRGLS